MRRGDGLAEYVYDALRSGLSRAQIREALTAAGWTPDKIDAALDSWADGTEGMPVPRPRPVVSPSEFAVYALLYGALGYAAVNLVALLHELIDLAAATELSHSYDLRWTLASLIVSVPLAVILYRGDRRRIAERPGARRSLMRSWTAHIAVLITAIVLLGALVSVIFKLLTFDLTGIYVTKALAVFVVGAGVLVFSMRETRSDSS